MNNQIKNILLKKLYDVWRWSKYLNVKLNEIEIEIEKPGTYKDSYYVHLTDDMIKNYKTKNFYISKDEIIKYDQAVIEKGLDIIKSEVHPYNLRSEFIENCFIVISQYTKEELLLKIKENLTYYLWWDLMTFEELINNLIKLHFLKSTTKLISEAKIIEYFRFVYKSKKELLDKIFTNFNPAESTINLINKEFRSDVIFDYRWAFTNDLKASIRIIENECRLYNNERIIGALFSEDILYKEVEKKFGLIYNVVSQGSPDWLKPQRFDIYIPSLNIAIEYQGDQHFRPVDFGGRGEKHAKKQFKENIQRDTKKKELAVANNCTIIYANPNYKIDRLIEEVSEAINQKNYST